MQVRAEAAMLLKQLNFSVCIDFLFLLSTPFPLYGKKRYHIIFDVISFGHMMAGR